MLLARHLSQLDARFQGGFVTIGNFDGVHSGHQQLFAQLKAQAHAAGQPCGAIIFEPQPQEFFSHQPPARLSSLRQKISWIAEQGIDFLLVLRFNQYLAQLSADDFIQQVLVQGLQIKHLVVGEDFRFGVARQGDYHTLLKAGQHDDFSVQAMPEVQIKQARVSSTAVRGALASGDCQQARDLLGRYFSIDGRVVHGSGRGHDLNMPTANIAMRQACVPVSGIFVVDIAWQGQRWPAVASVGTRPTFTDAKDCYLEVHIMDFDQDIYGERVQVRFLAKLRDEEKFETVAQLVAQMQDDLQAAKQWFKQHEQL